MMLLYDKIMSTLFTVSFTKIICRHAVLTALKWVFKPHHSIVLVGYIRLPSPLPRVVVNARNSEMRYCRCLCQSCVSAYCFTSTMQPQTTDDTISTSCTFFGRTLRDRCGRREVLKSICNVPITKVPLL